MGDLAYDWGLMTWKTKALFIALAVALVIVLASPHVVVLKPVTEGLGLTTTKYVYVPINHTVYVPPQWLSSLETVASGNGYCSGRLVVLPNNTAWFVWFWLVPSQYAGRVNLTRPGYVLYYNATTHYATFYRWVAYDLVGQGINYMGSGMCYTANATFNNYIVALCGDTYGWGPMNTIKYPISTIIPPGNATYNGVILLSFSGPSGPPFIYHTNTAITCDVTVTYVSNATAALWLPVTTNQTLVGYWRSAGELTIGHYDNYDYTMGYWVWNYPS